MPANTVTSNEQKQTDCETKIMNKALIIAPVVYLSVLGYVILQNWNLIWSGRFLDMSSVVPIVVWFGTLGGILAALQAIFAHNRHWDDGYDYWVIFSGVVGAAYGIASYFILMVITQSSHQVLLGTAVSAAFVVGCAQRQFTTLIHEVFDVIFQPYKKPPTQQVVTAMQETQSISKVDE